VKPESSPLALDRFQQLWDRRTRSGVDVVAALLSKQSAHPKQLRKIKRHRTKILHARRDLKNKKRLTDEEQNQLLRQIRKSRKKLAASTLAYLTAVQATITSPKFSLAITTNRKPPHVSKQTYSITSTTPDASYFAAMLLSDSINKAFSLSSPSRQDIVQGLSSAITGKWDKTVIRADIRSFYESIPHDQLLALVESNMKLDSLSKLWIRSLLAAYADSAHPAISAGLPRGIGPSASLSEAYLLSFDRKVKQKRECAYYARYVDDIVAVMATADPYPPRPSSYLDEFDDQLRALGLETSVSSGKRQELQCAKESLPIGANLQYLGYDIRQGSSKSKVLLEISVARASRIKDKIERSFAVYSRSASGGDKAASLLDLRIKYLTSNTRLVHSKRDAFVGINFSNRSVNSTDAMVDLDLKLQALIHATDLSGMDAVLRNRLANYSFVQGFNDVKYVRFSAHQWRTLTSIWKDIS
jgi:hypothetical protein